ncbi:MAG: hypothetical protein AMS27_15020 [Bacteroides sp. SM23_62_1]|nr:MAG: hypothetical protein AMS27_15020 [Bacteroides sp. SM23_62_1]
MKFLSLLTVYLFFSFTILIANPTITSHPSSATLCYSLTGNESVTLSVSATGNGTLSYQWYKDGGILGGATNPSVTIYQAHVIQEATFYCRVTDNDGSTNSNSATVTAILKPMAPNNLNVTASSYCPGSTIKLNAEGNASIDYDWYYYSGSCGGTLLGSGDNLDVTLSSITTYYVRGENVCGTGQCANKVVTAWTQSTAPGSVSVSVSEICSGDQTNLSVVGGSLGTNGVWRWYSGGCGTTYVSYGPGINVNPSTTTTYYVRAEGSCNTTICKSATITIKAVPTAPSASDKTICEGEDASLTATGTSLRWYSDAGLTEQVGTGSPYNTGKDTTGIYPYYVTQTTNDCESPAKTVILKINPNAKPDVLEDQVLCDDKLGEFLLGSAAQPGHSYSWTSSPAGYTSEEANPAVSPDTSVIFYLHETIDSSGCYADDTVSFTIHPTPVPEVICDTNICRNAVIPFQVGSTGKAGHGYEWISKPAGFLSADANPYVDPDNTTTYILTETILSTGCERLDSLTIIIYPVPVPQIANDTSICSGDLLPFCIGSDAKPGHTYLWISDQGGFSSTSSDPLIYPETTTQYYLLEKIDTTSCSSEDTVTVTIIPTPEIAIDYLSSYLSKGEQMTLTASGADQYVWSPATWLSTTAGASVTTSPLENIEYIVSGSNSFGCTDRDTIHLFVYCEECSDSILIAQTGYFNHGCRNNNYNDDADCSWTILPSGVSQIYLSFHPDSFDIRPGDWIFVYDGQDATADLLGKYNNDNLPPARITGGNALFVKLVTDGSGTGIGFQAMWTNEPATGINNSVTQGLKLYPNPANDKLFIEIDDMTDKDVRLFIYNHLGQMILNRQLEYSDGKIREELDISDLKDGMYLVRIVTSDDIYTQKVIKE